MNDKSPNQKPCIYNYELQNSASAYNLTKQSLQNFAGVVMQAMHVDQKPDQSVVVMKAFLNACEALAVSNIERSKLIGKDPSTLSRKKAVGFALDSKECELQLNFIRVYRSLYAIAGGDKKFMKHWYKTDNKALHGAPADLCQTILGLVRVNQYLDAMRGKV